MNIDRKYQIRAVNPCSGNTHDENDSILLLAKDKPHHDQDDCIAAISALEVKP